MDEEFPVHYTEPPGKGVAHQDGDEDDTDETETENEAADYASKTEEEESDQKIPKTVKNDIDPKDKGFNNVARRKLDRARARRRLRQVGKRHSEQIEEKNKQTENKETDKATNDFNDVPSTNKEQEEILSQKNDTLSTLQQHSGTDSSKPEHSEPKKEEEEKNEDNGEEFHKKQTTESTENIDQEQLTDQKPHQNTVQDEEETDSKDKNQREETPIESLEVEDDNIPLAEKNEPDSVSADENKEEKESKASENDDKENSEEKEEKEKEDKKEEPEPEIEYMVTEIMEGGLDDEDVEKINENELQEEPNEEYQDQINPEEENPNESKEDDIKENHFEQGENQEDEKNKKEHDTEATEKEDTADIKDEKNNEENQEEHVEPPETENAPSNSVKGKKQTIPKRTISQLDDSLSPRFARKQFKPANPEKIDLDHLIESENLLIESEEANKYQEFQVGFINRKVSPNNIFVENAINGKFRRVKATKKDPTDSDLKRLAKLEDIKSDEEKTNNASFNESGTNLSFERLSHLYRYHLERMHMFYRLFLFVLQALLSGICLHLLFLVYPHNTESNQFAAAFIESLQRTPLLISILVLLCVVGSIYLILSHEYNELTRGELWQALCNIIALLSTIILGPVEGLLSTASNTADIDGLEFRSILWHLFNSIRTVAAFIAWIIITRRLVNHPELLGSPLNTLQTPR
eukprot:gb/GECH01004647.1/.p1 GENE.gb/GECH01004647.1/~~gb/GECH01004647.1/.p1  ORF type:complete len:694 (+),score=212.26 gb/GECH01004647.1/:1-2082(+)